MTVKALYPTVLPSLNLDFANSKKLDPRITFTRASVGTFVNENGLIATAASGAARFDHDPVTGKCLGLLVEEARTNLLRYSEQFDNAAWSKLNTTIGANAVASPDGTLTADTFVESTDGSNQQHYINQVYSVTSGTSYTYTVFAKYVSRQWLVLTGNRNNWQAYFDIQNGVVGNKGSLASSSSITALANGWYRCSVTVVADSTIGVAFQIYAATANGTTRTPVYIGTGANAFYIWGAQLEAGAFPTSYIPTVASTVTRAADVASITGTNFSSWYRQDEGTVFCQGISNSRSNSSYWTTSNGGSNGAAVLVYPNNNITYQVVNSSIQVNSTFATYSAVSSVKTAAAIKLNNFAVVANGGAITSDTSGTVPAVTSFVIGNYLGGGTSFDYSGTIARLTYYPARLPDAQLQALTAT